MGALGKRVRLSCRVYRAFNRDTVGVVRRAGRGACYTFIRRVCIRVRDMSWNVGGDGVFPFAAVDFFVLSDGARFISRILQLLNGGFRRIWAYGKKAARLSLVADVGGVHMYGMFYNA